MLHRRMSENLKEEIARELGVYEIVKKAGWGAISSRNPKIVLPPDLREKNER